MFFFLQIKLGMDALSEHELDSKTNILFDMNDNNGSVASDAGGCNGFIIEHSNDLLLPPQQAIILSNDKSSSSISSSISSTPSPQSDLILPKDPSLSDIYSDVSGYCTSSSMGKFEHFRSLFLNLILIDK